MAKARHVRTDNEHWLVLTRTLVAGFNAPIDSGRDVLNYSFIGCLERTDTPDRPYQPIQASARARTPPLGAIFNVRLILSQLS
jgi:hypothetical protein